MFTVVVTALASHPKLRQVIAAVGVAVLAAGCANEESGSESIDLAKLDVALGAVGRLVAAQGV